MRSARTPRARMGVSARAGSVRGLFLFFLWGGAFNGSFVHRCARVLACSNVRAIAAQRCVCAIAAQLSHSVACVRLQCACIGADWGGRERLRLHELTVELAEPARD